MERGEPSGRSTSRYAVAFQSPRSRILCNFLRIRPTGMGLGPRHFQELANDQNVDRQIRQLMLFHGLDTREDAKTHSRQLMEEMTANSTYLEEDEIVEDAGLFDHDEALAAKGTQLV